jgi:dihydroflavonol-4-reductase
VKTTLVTGATGLVGNNIVRLLARRGRPVRALVRDIAKASPLMPNNVELVRGDITDRDSLDAAMVDCTVVYHSAGLPEQWLREPATFDRVNAIGTHNTVEASLAADVARFVYTSTIDTFTFPKPGSTFDETEIDPQPKATHYERSKQQADRIVVAAQQRGLPAIYVHPSGVYGPGPTTSPGTNQLIADLARSSVPMLLPGGMPVVYSLDVAEGHIRAEEQAAIGARYILSESYQSLQDVAAAVRLATGRSRIPPTMPLLIASAVAAIGESIAKMTNKPPLLPKGQLTFLQYEARPVAERAITELGWKPTSFLDGLAETLAFLKAAGRI